MENIKEKLSSMVQASLMGMYQQSNIYPNETTFETS